MLKSSAEIIKIHNSINGKSFLIKSSSTAYLSTRQSPIFSLHCAYHRDRQLSGSESITTITTQIATACD